MNGFMYIVSIIGGLFLLVALLAYFTPRSEPKPEPAKKAEEDSILENREIAGIIIDRNSELADALNERKSLYQKVTDNIDSWIENTVFGIPHEDNTVYYVDGKEITAFGTAGISDPDCFDFHGRFGYFPSHSHSRASRYEFIHGSDTDLLVRYPEKDYEYRNDESRYIYEDISTARLLGRQLHESVLIKAAFKNQYALSRVTSKNNRRYYSNMKVSFISFDPEQGFITSEETHLLTEKGRTFLDTDRKPRKFSIQVAYSAHPNKYIKTEVVETVIAASKKVEQYKTAIDIGDQRIEAENGNFIVTVTEL